MDYELEDRIIHALAELRLDYEDQMVFIREERKTGIKWETAGILVLLGKHPPQSHSKNNYFFLLNKRSANVQQPGDLCFPGGHPNKWIDLISSHLLVPYVLPLRKGLGFKVNRTINRKFFRTITYFLSNVLREGFEEIRLNPFQIEFLGPLRCYRLQLFHRVIFPLVGIIKKETKLRANWEVEKILRIPLTSLLHHDNYATYRLRVTERFERIFDNDWVDYECFIHREDGQPDEILWGATYNIIMSFLKVVFDFTPPDNSLRPIIEGELYPDT